MSPSRSRAPRRASDLSPQLNRRRHARPRQGRARAARRFQRPGFRVRLPARSALRVAVLALELVSLAIMVSQPAFAAKTVEVDGIKVLRRDAVVQEAGLAAQPQIFLVSADRIRAALLQEPYVRAVSVDLSLPGTVHIHVTEWQPYALMTSAGGTYLLSEVGVVLQAVRSTGPEAPALRLSVSASTAPAAGYRALSGRLLGDLGRMQASFPAAYGLQITGFELGADRQLVAVTRGGPRILFGQMVTEEQINSLDAKLASLKALSGRVDLAHSHLEYVNVMNPAEPVTRVLPSPSPSPSASPKRG